MKLRHQRLTTPVWIILFALLLTFGLQSTATPAAAGVATDRLPDLAMDRLKNISIQKLASGRKLLRFTVSIVNIGTGPFEVHGSRPGTSTAEMEDLSQRIYDDAGGYRDVPADATMFYAGDGHAHWHVRDLENYQLQRLTDSGVVGIGVKRGFCFFDNLAFRLSLPSAPQAPVYSYLNNPPACANGQPSALSAGMGLSIGWGDTYPASITGQYIEVTRVPNGKYRLMVTADPSNWFVESNDLNNFAWANIKIYNGVVSVLSYSPLP